MRRAWCIAWLAVVAAAAGAPERAGAQVLGSTPPAAVPDTLTAPPVAHRPPPGWDRSAREVIRAAERLPRVRRATAGRERPYVRAFLKEGRQWQVSFYEGREDAPDREVAQVVVDDRTGAVRETWTGIQVAWMMARGYPGAFGRAVNAPYVWIGLLVAFGLPFLRRPLRLVHLDIAAVASLSASYALFGAAEIEWSVPLAYPPLVYLLARLLWIARDRARGRRRPPLRLLLGPDALLFGAVFLLGFRIALGLTSSNVIDVGYAGVIGADRILDGERLYGGFPSDNPRGDTYGPVNYLAYVPFEALLPWSGIWDELPAGRAAAMAFDVLAAGGMWLLGRRLGGPGCGLLLAYLWLACPWTLLVANSGANDGLVAVLVIGALLAAGRPGVRGAVLAAAALTKFAPLALLPLFAVHPARGRGLTRRAAATLGAAALAGAGLLVPVALLDGGLAAFADRTLGFQLGRESPFSVWGLWGLEWPQRVAQAGAVVLACAAALRARSADGVTLAALAGAVLIAVQLAATHWFYLYVVWFLPAVLAAVVASYGAGRSTGSIESARPRSEQRMTTALSHGSSSDGT